MATVSLNVPDAFVAELVEILAAEMAVPVPTTAQGKLDLAQAWWKKELKRRLIDKRANDLALAFRAGTDPAVTW
jgi:hypothetical protein